MVQFKLKLNFLVFILCDIDSNHFNYQWYANTFQNQQPPTGVHPQNVSNFMHPTPLPDDNSQNLWYMMYPSPPPNHVMRYKTPSTNVEPPNNKPESPLGLKVEKKIYLSVIHLFIRNEIYSVYPFNFMDDNDPSIIFFKIHWIT